MKSLIAICCVILLICNAQAKSPKPDEAKKFDAVPAFQQLVKSSSTPKEWTRVYLNSRNQKWAKQYYSIGELKYDVRKTDSLIAPIIGIVSFPIAIRQSEFFDSEEDAEQSTALSLNPGLDYRIEGTFHAQDTGWQLQQFKYKDAAPNSALRGSEYTFTEDKLRTQQSSALGEALKKWLR